MTNFVQVIKACENAGGEGTKKTIQAALATADHYAMLLISEALNPYRVFGVKKFDRLNGVNQLSEADDSKVQSFLNILDQLVARNITGDAARNEVALSIDNLTKEEQDYFVRVIDKDLKAGFSAETFNKVTLAKGIGSNLEDSLKIITKKLKDGGMNQFVDNPNFKYLIPTFEVMLADKCDDVDDFEKYVTFPCQADFKYDGERTIAVVKKDTITYYSRSGIEATHVNGLFDEDLRSVHNYLGYDYILDGERCSDKGFIDTVNAKKEGNDEAKANLRFRAFFLMPLTDWLNQKTNITMHQNRESLTKILDDTKVVKIILSEGREVKDYQDMIAYCNDAIDLPENAARKIEGLILKNWESTYQWDRTFAWTKVKRFFDVDARIVGFYPGRPKSRLADTVGGVNCIAFLENGERVEFNVGSGFSDDDRADMKANPDKWLKGVHVIKYQEVSRAKNKDFASLRFCTYERSRDDKVVEI